MGQLRVLNGQEVVALLQKQGFEIVRRRGSHVILRGTIDSQTRSVPVPLHRPLKQGTLGGIIEQSGLPRELFETN